MASTSNAATSRVAERDPDADSGRYFGQEEQTTETRRSFATSEFWIFILLSTILVFFAYESGTDSFSRDDAWRYVTWLGIGYLVTRGLAKSGSYETFTRRRDH